MGRSDLERLSTKIVVYGINMSICLDSVITVISKHSEYRIVFKCKVCWNYSATLLNFLRYFMDR